MTGIPCLESLEVRALLSSISGFVFHDAVTDGVQQRTDDAIPGAQVQLWSAGPDGVIGGNNDVLLQEKFTDINGRYQFAGLNPGAHFVQFVRTGPFVWTHSGRGIDPTVSSDADPVTGITGIVQIGADTDITNLNAGIVQSGAVEDRANAAREAFQLTESTLKWSTARWFTGEQNQHGNTLYFVSPDGRFYAWKPQGGVQLVLHHASRKPVCLEWKQHSICRKTDCNILKSRVFRAMATV